MRVSKRQSRMGRDEGRGLWSPVRVLATAGEIHGEDEEKAMTWHRACACKAKAVRMVRVYIYLAREMGRRVAI